MTCATIGEFPSSQLPSGEQLLRLNRLSRHLAGFLFRYSFEPQTEEAFRQRETLREELGALEEKCRHLSGLLKKGGGMLESLKGDLTSLHVEFNRLEGKVRRYLDQC